MKITIPYIIIMDELQKRSDNGELQIKEARYYINMRFRFGKENLRKLLLEMEGLGLIKINKHKIKIQPS